MQKLILIFLLVSSSLGSAAVMKSYRLVWDTSKIASFGWGFGYNIFDTGQSKEPFSETGGNARFSNDNLFGPLIGAEVGITGYEYLAGVQLGKIQKLSKSTYIMTIFTGRSANWIDLKTNIEKDHYVFGVRLNRKFIDWAIKYHTDFKADIIISIQFGISG
ncbi:hypothetical protein ACFL4L_06060 [bacterium]